MHTPSLANTISQNNIGYNIENIHIGDNIFVHYFAFIYHTRYISESLPPEAAQATEVLTEGTTKALPQETAAGYKRGTAHR